MVAAALSECLRERDCLDSQLQTVMSYTEGLHRELKSLRQAKRDCIVWKAERDKLQKHHDDLIDKYQKLLQLVCLNDQACLDTQKTAATAPGRDGIELESVMTSPMSEVDDERRSSPSASCRCRVESIVDYKAMIALLNYERQEKEKVERILQDILSKVNYDLLNKHKVKFGNAQVFDFTAG